MNRSSEQHGISRELTIVAGIAVLAAAIAVFVSVSAHGFSGRAVDPYDYGRIGHGLVEHGFNQLTRRAAMLYPHLLWLVYGLGGNDMLVLLIHVFLHAGTCSLVFILGRHLFNQRTGLIAGVMVALHPMLLRYLPELHTETLLVFMCVLTVWVAIRFYEQPSIGRGVVFGAVAMIGVLTKGVMLPVALAFIGVFALIFLRRPQGRMQALAGVCAVGITMAAICAPWTYRNYAVSGHFVLLTPGMPDAFLRGYIFTRKEFATLQRPPYTDAENESNALFHRIARENGTTWEKDEIQDDINNGKVMRQWIRERPLDTLRKIIVGLFTFWYEMTSLKNSLVPLLLALACWVLAFAGWKRARLEKRRYWLVLLPIVVQNAFVALLIPLGRYSVPILPLLAILAAFGVDTLLEARFARAKSIESTHARS